MKPYFSVIIPTLNEEDHLPKLLDSLCKQTYVHFETIIVDASSEDGTIKVAETYKNVLRDLKIIKSRKRNLPYQKNIGAKKAIGQYFIFFDADVVISPTFLEEVCGAIEIGKHVFLTTWIKGDSNNLVDKSIVLMINLFNELGRLVGKPLAHGPDTIIRRDVFFLIKGFREDLRIIEDYDFSIRVRKAGYDLVILRKPELVVSLRRFRSEGRLSVINRWTLGIISLLINKPTIRKNIHYSMGGHVHNRHG